MPIQLRLVMCAAALFVPIASDAGAQDSRDAGPRPTIVAITAPTVAFRPVIPRAQGTDAVVLPDSLLAMPQSTAQRSRSRGARRGLVIGLVGGALIGLALTNDFMDEPAVNMLASAGFFGLVGAGVGALIGAAPEVAPTGDERRAAPR